MDDQRPEADEVMRERARWLHDVRNAVNTAGVSVALTRRLLERGDTAGALEMLGVAGESWGRCRDLLASSNARPAPSQTEADELVLRPRGAAAPEQPAPPTRR